MMPVLCLVTFVVLASGEARAAELPSQTAQQGTAESVTIINGKVAVPVPVGTPPPATPPVETPPVTPPVNPSPEPALEPTPVDSSPEPAPEPTPEPTPPAPPTGGAEPTQPGPSPVTETPAPDAGGAPPPASEPSVREVVPKPVTFQGNGSLPVPATAPATAPLEEAPTGTLAAFAAALLGNTAPATAPAAGATPMVPPTSPVAPKASGPSPIVPAPYRVVPSGVTPRLPSGMVEVAASAASAASAAAEVFSTLARGVAGLSAAGTQEEQPSEDTPTPTPAPLTSPAAGGYFSASTGVGGQLGTGGGFAPLLVGILALLATLLLRGDFRTYLISCEIPKPSSALLGPLERPG